MRRSTVVGLLVVLGWAASGASGGTEADFDSLALAAESHWNGEPTIAMPAGFEADYRARFGEARFNTYYTVDLYSGWPFWAGWAYSNETDTTTAGHGNQFSAIAGGAQSGSNYAVGYPSEWYGIVPTVTLDSETALDGVYVTNTTYAYLTMRDGDPYGWAKQFGGKTGNDADWFLLTITGKDTGGTATGTVLFYLADYRFANPAQDYLVEDWTKVDLTGLGAVKTVEFRLTSSDSGPWGINTPAYFALDTLLVPEPATLVLLAAGAGAVEGWRRRRRG